MLTIFALANLRNFLLFKFSSIDYFLLKNHKILYKEKKVEKIESNNNTLKQPIKYEYEIKTLKSKKGKNETNQKTLIFYTENDENTRFIEDIAEELVKLNNLPLTTTIFFENQGDKWWRIDLNWDNNRYRGCCFVEITNPFAIVEEAKVI